MFVTGFLCQNDMGAMLFLGVVSAILVSYFCSAAIILHRSNNRGDIMATTQSISTIEILLDAGRTLIQRKRDQFHAIQRRNKVYAKR